MKSTTRYTRCCVAAAMLFLICSRSDGQSQTFPPKIPGGKQVVTDTSPAFLKPTDTLRDGVSALLAQVPCSRLQVAFDPDTATLQVRGHIPETGLRSPVLAALQEQMGADIKVSDNILILPRPQCGALALARPRSKKWVA